MLRKQPPTWVFFGSFSLAFIAGVTNSIGFLGVAHQGMTHVTGTVTLSTIELAQGNVMLAVRALTVVGFFFVGAVLSGVIIHDSHLRLTRAYGIALLVEGALLLGALVSFRGQNIAGEYFAAAACGLQNALATHYSGATLRTTHMTGIVTDLGSIVGQALRRQTVDWFRFRLYVVLLLGFAIGGTVGGVLYPVFHSDALALPALYASLLGVGALAWLRGRSAAAA